MHNRPPDVTVVVATRDRPGLLERAVASILNQDYPGRVECIVVYDHVPVRDLVVPVGPNRALKLISNTRTQGLPGGRNSGVDAATGELLAFCDDDDIWLPAKLSRQVALLAHPEIGAVSCGLRLRGPGIDKDRVLDRDFVYLGDFLADRIMEVHSSTMLVRRSIWAAAGEVDEGIPGGYSEDYEWLLRVAAQTPIAIVREALVIVDWHGGSFYFGRWAMIVEAQRYLIEKHPELAQSREGMARLRGQIAFALASGHRRTEAIKELAAVLRLNPREKRVLVTVPVIMGLMTGERALRMAQKRGKGI
ncbi:glycosyltransferase family A protein [Actinoplanes sp. N902-109]|uniref:glycosyltransferase family 2 protein n=1 Tax=Actinoplanes sp. (strain N902-109) TaxID=649831 RepID=UPI00032964A7|nr:glycosyltransferase family A protein [Actinoplanes sp. N902-109]AGL19983.1 glycosyl transferase family protein [Actinoplanes sp. N902-109]